MTTATRKQQSKNRREKLRQMTKQIASMSEGDRAVLASRMGGVQKLSGGPLSLKNQALLAMQTETASVVGGYDQWLDAGRVVKEKEKASWLRIPITVRDVDPEEDRKRMRFKFAPFFDISQTEEISAEKVAEIKSRKKKGKGRSVTGTENVTKAKKVSVPDWHAKPALKPKYKKTEDSDLDDEFAAMFS